jgi:hypothetical protein
MSNVRRTFVVNVHDRGRSAVVEDVRTGERIHVDDISRLGRDILLWLANPPGTAIAMPVEDQQAPSDDAPPR